MTISMGQTLFLCIMISACICADEEYLQLRKRFEDRAALHKSWANSILNNDATGSDAVDASNSLEDNVAKLQDALPEEMEGVNRAAKTMVFVHKLVGIMGPFVNTMTLELLLNPLIETAHKIERQLQRVDKLAAEKSEAESIELQLEMEFQINAAKEEAIQMMNDFVDDKEGLDESLQQTVEAMMQLNALSAKTTEKIKESDAEMKELIGKLSNMTANVPPTVVKSEL